MKRYAQRFIYKFIEIIHNSLKWKVAQMSINEDFNKYGYIHAIVWYSPIKSNKLLTHATHTDESQYHYAEPKKLDTTEYIVYDSTHEIVDQPN